MEMDVTEAECAWYVRSGARDGSPSICYRTMRQLRSEAELVGVVETDDVPVVRANHLWDPARRISFQSNPIVLPPSLSACR